MNFLRSLFFNKVKPEGFPFVLKHIQTIRFAMALLEQNPKLQMPIENKPIFDYLNNYFSYDVSYYTSKRQVKIRKDISFEHQAPKVCVNAQEKTLVFPKQMLDLCFSKWGKREKITFSGYQTDIRVKALTTWLKEVNGVSVNLSDGGYSQDKIDIVWSNTGRQMPQKSWDEAYYNELLNSGFVLCPDGDFIWTYRFFEAIICGAIPIIENMCSHYEGYFFYDMKTPMDQLIYNRDKALENLNHLIRTMTLGEV